MAAARLPGSCPVAWQLPVCLPAARLPGSCHLPGRQLLRELPGFLPPCLLAILDFAGNARRLADLARPAVLARYIARNGHSIAAACHDRSAAGFVRCCARAACQPLNLHFFAELAHPRNLGS